LFDCDIEEVIKLYEFDRLLRFYILDAILIIETIIKTNISYYIAIKYGKFGHYELKNFKDEHKNWLSKVIESFENKKEIKNGKIIYFFKEIFLKYYRKKYMNKEIPIWMFIELLSFGETSKLFSNMRYNDQLKISKNLISDKIETPDFAKNLFYTLSITRNICSHNSRLWNKVFNFKFSTKGIKNTELTQINLFQVKTGSIILLINYILRKNYFDKDFLNIWQQNIESLIDNHPKVPNFWESIGLLENWKENALWRGEI